MPGERSDRLSGYSDGAFCHVSPVHVVYVCPPREEAPELAVGVLDRALLVADEGVAEESVGPLVALAALDLGEAPEAGVAVGEDGREDLAEVLGAQKLLEPVEDEEDRVGRALPDPEQQREAEEGEEDVEDAVAVVRLGA